MVSHRSVYDCRRPANPDLDTRAEQNDNANIHDHADQTANRDSYHYIDARANAYGYAQPDQDDHAHPDGQPHPAADFDNAPVTHTAGDGYALAQSNETSHYASSLMSEGLS